MKTKLLLVIFSAFFFFLQVNGQLKVNSNGKVGIGTSNPQYGLLQIGKSGVNNGIAIYDSLKSLPPFKMYVENNFGLLNFGMKEKGLVITKDGHLAVGSPLRIGYEYPPNALLNLYNYPSNPACALMAYSQFTFDWGDIIKVYSTRNTDVAYVVRDISKGTDKDEMTFFVYGDGTIYSKGNSLTASDESYKDNH